jgi:hypothetical protein
MFLPNLAACSRSSVRYDNTMPEYQMHDAVIDLPAQFKDKTMHLFTADEAGGSTFTFVVSRAPMEADDTIQTFTTRLVSEMRKTLPGFQLSYLHESEVDGLIAREIDYRWMSDGTQLHQRQTVVMSPMLDGDRTAISFIGTTSKGFTREREATYLELIGSVVLKRPGASEFVAEPLEVGAVGQVFVLHEPTRTLYALPSVAELFRHDVTEMTSGVTFYDARGARLSLGPAPQGMQAWSRPDGAFLTLWTTDPLENTRLETRLDGIAAVKGSAGLSTVAEVRAVLAAAGSKLDCARAE